MFLYTIILDFLGGTYISQVRAESKTDAIVRWTHSLDDRIPEVSLVNRNELADGLELEKLVPLNGLVNAWCMSALVNDGLALLHIIKTDDSLS